MVAIRSRALPMKCSKGYSRGRALTSKVGGYAKVGGPSWFAVCILYTKILFSEKVGGHGPLPTLLRKEIEMGSTAKEIYRQATSVVVPAIMDLRNFGGHVLT